MTGTIMPLRERCRRHVKMTQCRNWISFRMPVTNETPARSRPIGTLVERATRFTMLLHLPPMDGHGTSPRVKNGPALAGRTGAGSRLAAQQDSQAVTAPRLRFQVARGAPPPELLQQAGQFLPADLGQRAVGAEPVEQPVQHTGVAAAGVRVGVPRRGQERVGRGLDRTGVPFAQGHDFPGHLLLLSRCTG